MDQMLPFSDGSWGSIMRSADTIVADQSVAIVSSSRDRSVTPRIEPIAAGGPRAALMDAARAFGLQIVEGRPGDTQPKGSVAAAASEDRGWMPGSCDGRQRLAARAAQLSTNDVQVQVARTSPTLHNAVLNLGHRGALPGPTISSSNVLAEQTPTINQSAEIPHLSVAKRTFHDAPWRQPNLAPDGETQSVPGSRSCTKIAQSAQSFDAPEISVAHWSSSHVPASVAREHGVPSWTDSVVPLREIASAAAQQLAVPKVSFPTEQRWQPAAVARPYVMPIQLSCKSTIHQPAPRQQEGNGVFSSSRLDIATPVANYIRGEQQSLPAQLAQKCSTTSAAPSPWHAHEQPLFEQPRNAPPRSFPHAADPVVPCQAEPALNHALPVPKTIPLEPVQQKPQALHVVHATGGALSNSGHETRIRGAKLQVELCPRPFTHLLFLVRCVPEKWPAALQREVAAWPGAQIREDGHLSFPTAHHGDVEQRLRGLSGRGLELELLPDWVQRIAGFSSEGATAHPPLGMELVEARKSVERFIEKLPEPIRRAKPVMPYQVEGVAFGLHRGGRVLLGDEMGLGKTVQALLLAAQFETEWPLLVVAPSSLRFVWRDQAAQWLPQLVGEDGSGVHVITNGKDRVSSRARIVVGTYDLVRRCEALQARPDGRNYLVIIVDESQNIKNEASQRTKAVVGLCKAARRVMLLSGTPALNRAYELYSQLEALLPSEVPSQKQFAERYCVKQVQRYGRRTVEKWGDAKRLGELNCILGSVMIRRLKKDVLHELPSKLRMRVPLDHAKMNLNLLKEVSKQVRKMGSNAKQFFEGGGSETGLPELFRLTAEAKLGAVMEHVEHLLELGVKFLLFGHHHVVLDALGAKLAELKVQHVRIDGKTPHTHRPRLVTRFQEEESVRVALLSITAAGAGITLTAASTVVFAELYWVPGQMHQAEDRAHRIGQQSSVSVQYLVAGDTLDDVLFRALEKKSLSTSAILDGHKRGLAAEHQCPERAAERAGAQPAAKRARTGILGPEAAS